MDTGNRKYVITGGPGSGKSTLLEGLEKAGYSCSAEISREMIKAEVAKGTDCLPWLDILCFSDRVIHKMINAWELMSPQTMAFFDRGIPDVIAYIKIAGLPVPPHYPEHITQHPYHKQVFILPPWKEIYVNDSERWQDFGESASIYQAIRETYIDYGYELIEVPKASLEERIAFVLGFIRITGCLK